LEDTMVQVQLLEVWVAAQYLAVQRRVRGDDSERGDVPGWVMVTVMTAGLVVAIFAMFKGRITGAISDALDSVTTGAK
jgi:hypothetical protein